MRQLEIGMCAAVQERKNWRDSNTQVSVCGDEVVVYLHGNAIYRVVDGVEYFSLAGWNTNTTRSRLRAMGVDITTRQGQAYVSSIPVRNDVWVRI